MLVMGPYYVELFTVKRDSRKMALLHLGLGQLTHCPWLGTFFYLTQRGEQPGFFSPTPLCPSTLLFLALKVL